MSGEVITGIGTAISCGGHGACVEIVSQINLGLAITVIERMDVTKQ